MGVDERQDDAVFPSHSPDDPYDSFAVPYSLSSPDAVYLSAVDGDIVMEPVGGHLYRFGAHVVHGSAVIGRVHRIYQVAQPGVLLRQLLVLGAE